MRLGIQLCWTKEGNWNLWPGSPQSYSQEKYVSARINEIWGFWDTQTFQYMETESSTCILGFVNIFFRANVASPRREVTQQSQDCLGLEREGGLVPAPPFPSTNTTKPGEASAELLSRERISWKGRLPLGDLTIFFLPPPPAPLHWLKEGPRNWILLAQHLPESLHVKRGCKEGT